MARMPVAAGAQPFSKVSVAAMRPCRRTRCWITWSKEVDQEENVWRSLPFFASTLALQVAALGTPRGWIAGIAGPELIAAAALFVAAGGATLAALVFLVPSVWPAEYLRLMSEPLVLACASKLRSEDIAMAGPGASRLAVAEDIPGKVFNRLGAFAQRKTLPDGPPRGHVERHLLPRDIDNIGGPGRNESSGVPPKKRPPRREYDRRSLTKP